MKKLLTLLLGIMVTQYSFSQNKITTSPPLAGGNGAGGVTFLVTPKTAIFLDSIEVALYGSVGSRVNMEVWYSTTDTAGAPTISTTTGWTLLDTAQAVIQNSGTTNPVLSQLEKSFNFNLVANTVYRFFIGYMAGSSGNVVYTTWNTSNQDVFFDSNLEINTGPPYAYGGSAPNPGNNPRQFNGAISYRPATGTDVMASALLSPTPPMAASSLVTVNMQLRNGAANTITTADVGYQLNNNTPVTASWSGSVASGATGNYSFATQLTLPSGIGNVLKVWANNPNGIGADLNPLNDTLSTTLCFGLAGTYTIGSAVGNDFADLGSALAALSCGGASANVVFNLDTGTHNGNFVVPSFAGNSTFGLTIKSKSNSAANTIVSNGGSGTTIDLNGAKNVTISHLTIERSNTSGNTNENTIHAFGSELITITNNIINTPLSNTNFNNNGVHLDNCTTMSVSNNMISGGYYGIRIEGNSTADKALNTFVLNNEIKDAGNTGMYFIYVSNIIIDNNVVTDPSSNGNGTYGVYLANGDRLIMSNNIIQGKVGTYGIYMSNFNEYLGVANRIYNNVVNAEFNGTGFIYGMYISMSSTTASDKHTIVGNTINMTTNSTSTGTFGAVYVTGTTSALNNLTFINNNITAQANSTSTFPANMKGLYISSAVFLDSMVMSNNNYYINGGLNDVVRVNSPANNYATIAAWQTASSLDANSVSMNPFYNPTTVIPSSASFNNLGTPTFVTIDVTGAPRNATTPDIGAYEFSPSAVDVGIVALDSPLAGCGLSAAESIVIQVKNFGSASASNITVKYEVSGTVNFVSNAQVIAGPLTSGSQMAFTFPQTVNMAMGGTYNFTVYSSMTGDGNPLNDTMMVTVINPLVSAFPYKQDFESTTGSQASSTMPSGWNQVATSTPRWYSNQGGTSSGGTGPTVDNTLGTTSGRYVYLETSSGAGFDYLESPCLSLSSLTNPKLSFYYHMNGATMGDLYVQAKVGSNWVLLDSLKGQQQSNQTDPWLQMVVDLNSVGAATQIRFLGIRGTSFTGDMALDDIEIYQGSNKDMSVVELLNPKGKCGLTTTEKVTVVLRNMGNATERNFAVKYQFQANPIVSQMVTDSIMPGDTLHFTFTTPINVAMGGSYSLKSWSELVGDLNKANDSIIEIIVNPLISTFPYVENFETTTGTGINGTFPSGWSRISASAPNWQVAQGTTPSSATGATKDHTLGTASGRYLFLETSGGAPGDFDYLLSPCVNISSIVGPRMSFWYHMHGASMGKLTLEVLVGANWMAIDSLVGQQQPAQTDDWKRMIVDLSAYSTLSQVRFRGERGTSFTGDMGIDDISIFQGPAKDIMMASIVQTAAGSCSRTANDTVKVVVRNVGTQAQSNIPVRYKLGANPVVNGTVAGPLAPGTSVTYTFAQTINVSAAGTYNLVAYSALVGDTSTFNDTTMTSILTSSSMTAPVNQNFTANNGGWIAGGINSTWAHGAPTGTKISMAASSPNAWVTNLSGDYNSNENSFIASPCIDFAALQQPKVRFDMFVDLEDDWDYGFLEYSTNGGNSWTVLGDSATGINWYNYKSIQGVSAPSWSGNTQTGWLKAEHSLTMIPAALRNKVRFRFHVISDASVTDEGLGIDNFEVVGVTVVVPYTDLKLNRMISPTAGSRADTATVTVNIKNVGTASISPGFDLAFNVNGTVRATETPIFTTPLAPGDSMNYTFTNKFTTASGGNYRLCAYIVGLSADTISNNDTSCVNVISKVAVNDIFTNNDFVVYPNPANNWVNISTSSVLSDKAQFQMIDQLGKVVYQTTLKSGLNKYNVNIGNVSEGLYTYRILSGNAVKTGLIQVIK